jgi:hypothetical protein
MEAFNWIIDGQLRPGYMMLQPDVPAGGARQSGMGVERVMEGLAELTQGHIVYVAK